MSTKKEVTLLTIVFIGLTILALFMPSCLDDTNCALEVNDKVYDCKYITDDGITACCYTEEDLVFCTDADKRDGKCEAE